MARQAGFEQQTWKLWSLRKQQDRDISHEHGDAVVQSAKNM